jgi:lipopolysaccharide export LptBFGC system permease protein LptF
MKTSPDLIGLALLYRIWKYGRLCLAVLAFILMAMALSIGPGRMADFIVKCGDSLQHLWK